MKSLRSKSPNWEKIWGGVRHYGMSCIVGEREAIIITSGSVERIRFQNCQIGNAFEEMSTRASSIVIRGTERRIMRARGHYDICPRPKPDKD